MSCVSPESKPDWKAYVLRELGQDAHRQAEAHLAACSTCHEEVATLRLTLDTLSTLREEEMPRRIAFVSDKVFEPRWWQRVFESHLRRGLPGGGRDPGARVHAAGARQVKIPQAQVDAAVNEGHLARWKRGKHKEIQAHV